MGIFDFLRREAKTEDRAFEYYPEHIEQYSDKSIVASDGRYDLSKFSHHEDKVIKAVIDNTNGKYPSRYRAIGLANESYPIVYKPRYVLFDIVILCYEDSCIPLDKIAVSFSYIQKSASFRPLAIEYFEKAVDRASLREMDRFSSICRLSMLSKVAETYEKEHDYKKAIKWYEYMIDNNIGGVPYYREKVAALYEKDKNWKPLRRRKQSEADLQFDRDVRTAAIAYSRLLKT